MAFFVCEVFMELAPSVSESFIDIEDILQCPAVPYQVLKDWEDSCQKS